MHQSKRRHTFRCSRDSKISIAMLKHSLLTCLRLIWPAPWTFFGLFGGMLALISGGRMQKSGSC